MNIDKIKLTTEEWGMAIDKLSFFDDSLTEKLLLEDDVTYSDICKTLDHINWLIDHYKNSATP